MRRSIFPIFNALISKSSLLSSFKKKYTSCVDDLKNVDCNLIFPDFPDDCSFKILKYLNGFNVINNISLVNRYYYRLIFLSNSGNINLLKTLVKQDYKEEVDVKLWTDKKVDVKLWTDKKQSRSKIILDIYEYYYSTIYYETSIVDHEDNFFRQLLDSSPPEIFVHWYWVVMINNECTDKFDEEIFNFVWLNGKDEQIVAHLSYFAGLINEENSTKHGISRIFIDYFIFPDSLGYESTMIFATNRKNVTKIY